MRLPVRRAIKLIELAAENERREYFYHQWLMRLALMTKETFISFEEFYEMVQTPQVDNRPKEVIMRELLGG